MIVDRYGGQGDRSGPQSSSGASITPG